jgi:hypothetical protein
VHVLFATIVDHEGRDRTASILSSGGAHGGRASVGRLGDPLGERHRRHQLRSARQRKRACTVRPRRQRRARCAAAAPASVVVAARDRRRAPRRGRCSRRAAGRSPRVSRGRVLHLLLRALRSWRVPRALRRSAAAGRSAARTIRRASGRGTRVLRCSARRGGAHPATACPRLQPTTSAHAARGVYVRSARASKSRGLWAGPRQTGSREQSRAWLAPVGCTPVRAFLRHPVSGGSEPPAGLSAMQCILMRRTCFGRLLTPRGVCRPVPSWPPRRLGSHVSAIVATENVPHAGAIVATAHVPFATMIDRIHADPRRRGRVVCVATSGARCATSRPHGSKGSATRGVRIATAITPVRRACSGGPPLTTTDDTRACCTRCLRTVGASFEKPRLVGGPAADRLARAVACVARARRLHSRASLPPPSCIRWLRTSSWPLRDAVHPNAKNLLRSAPDPPRRLSPGAIVAGGPAARARPSRDTAAARRQAPLATRGLGQKERVGEDVAQG